MKFPRKQTVTDQAKPHLSALKIGDLYAESSLVDRHVWDRLEVLFQSITRLLGNALPEAQNPFVQLGAVANTMFVIAVMTGILLLFWYKPSVHQAYDSLQMMLMSPYLAELVRSIHRYSSDACILFVIFHFLQILGTRMVSKVRWLAWVSGVVTLGLLWIDGWTGYWLVWDERAQLVAKSTAKLLDVLPIFADPLSRSFLVDDGVNTLLFFVVFFIHMLIPLAMAVALWIHIVRLNDAHFFTERKMTGAIIAVVVIVSLICPVESAAPAAMQALPQNMTFDWFYLLPIFLTDRLQGSMLWLLTLVGIIAVFSVPWWITRRRSTPLPVDEGRCHGCKQCFHDCPFNAVTMITREGSRPTVSSIDPNKCVGCGVCVGSCDTFAIEYPVLSMKETKRWLGKHLRADLKNGMSPRHLAFICTRSAGSGLWIKENGDCDEMPGYRVVSIPCVSWLFAPMIGQIIDSGVPGVLIVGCGLNPSCRMGNTWMEQRLSGKRKPFLNPDKLRSKQILHVCYDRSERQAMLQVAADFRLGRPVRAAAKLDWKRWPIAVAIIVIVNSCIVSLSDAPYQAQMVEQSELIVSFKHPGKLVAKTDHATVGDDLDVLPHMRPPTGVTTERYRTPVRLKVDVDGNEFVHRSYAPRGLFSDGVSIAVEHIPLSIGEHTIRIQLGDSEDASEWLTVDETIQKFEKHKCRVALFNKLVGFEWH